MAVQRTTKTEALKKMLEKYLNNLEIHFKLWGCPHNWRSIDPCTGSNGWDLSFPALLSVSKGTAVVA